MNKKLFGIFVVFVIGFFLTKPVFGQDESLFKKIQQVLVVNDSTQPVPVEVTNQSSGSTQWELTSTCNGYANYFANRVERLNNYADEGWELVEVEDMPYANTVCEYYKRPVP